MDLVALALITAAMAVGLLALGNWRAAYVLVVLVGFIQDPLRKVIPGEPVFLVVLCTGVMVLAMIGAMIRYGFISMRPLTLGNKTTELVLSFFVILVVLQAGMSFMRFGSLVVSMIGLLAYLSPIAAVWLAWCYVRGEADVRRFLAVYVCVALVAVASVLLSKSGVTWSILRQVGEGITIYDLEIGKLDLHSGLMRSPEIAAWHAGAASCFLMVLAVTFRSVALRVLTPVVVLGCLTAGMLTGRRKMLIVVLGFAAIYFLLLFYFRQRSGRRALIVVALASAALISSALTLAPQDREYRPYVERGQSVFSEIDDRFTQMGLASIGWGYQAGGFFGLGAGAGSQGTQHFTIGPSLAVGASEGGLGKIVVELGIPGLVLALLASILVARNVRRALAFVSQHNAVLTRLLMGSLAFVAANVPVFVGASQVYGDPFVLIILGSLLGFILAGPRVIRLTEQRVQAAAQVRLPAGVRQLTPIARA